MKFNTLASGIMLGLLSLTSDVACAENVTGEKFYVGAFGEYYWADWDDVESSNTINLGESLGVGFEFGYRFTDDWTARLAFAVHNFNIENEDDHKQVEYYGAALLYHFDDNPLYVIAGYKYMDAYRSFNMANLGLGMRHYLADDLAVSGEINWYEGIDETHTDISLKLGINYFFGQSDASYQVKETAEPAIVSQVSAPTKPMDTDKDGVYDLNDQCANTPTNYAVDVKGCTLMEEREVSVRLLVNFPNDNSDVNSQYLADIKKVADFLNSHQKSSVRLEGHTSAQGDENYNQKLSERRAKAVGEVLTSQYDIAYARVTTIGYGESRLINQADNEIAHAKNRRVVADITTVEMLPVKR
ncbi:OmpA family protein [Pseudoalteromonas denitrificans]|uniref:OmpA-OmpF porin, OOP family n=1 Tax=Pseudoalteromonas denitrificans DSM 6059 TaxID=1123010 RepID=A0A1I1DRA3_9GAMM|nr:OmpA family protein [Pseudoalteromonas denitrificans]SFB77515.1 OmpA-OmpF porin, OOP family [Pseudoalteromonas denitrificans DSM 6059]